MQWSHSRLETFQSCPYKYKLRYLDAVKVLPPDNADNALFLGTALHTGIQHGEERAIAEYYNSFPIITDEHINEAIKLEYVIPRAYSCVPKDGIFEVKISKPGFLGYADLLVPVGNNEFDLYDFKYSNHADKYKDSVQLHVYKHYLEPEYKIRDMYFLIISKVNIKQGKQESLCQFRNRISSELAKTKATPIPIEYNPQKVTDFKNGIKKAEETNYFAKNPNYLCNWCDYQQLCEKGNDYMILPENKKRQISGNKKMKMWLYGAPFSGKTTFANMFPSPLMLNTDGNVSFVDAPFIPLKDEVRVDGRITNKTLAWEVFKNAISELEKKQNGFKTLVVDLIEDLYEHCRLYMYKQIGITHESDDSYRAWDKVRTEFLSTIKRLVNLDYENIILISHEDTSKDITRKTGDKITTIKPNLTEKMANKLAGMVDIVARVIAEDNNHTLSFKTSEVIFGGGRLKMSTSEIPLDYGEFQKACAAANGGAATKIEEPAPEPEPKPAPTPEAEPSDKPEAELKPTPEAEPTTRTRRRRSE